MNQSNALQYDYAELAEVSDMSIIVKGRILEAADTIAHMDIGGLRPAKMKSCWPAVTPDPHSYGYNDFIVPYHPSSAAISRAEEVSYGWMLQYVHDDERRIILGRWAMCIAVPRIAGSFREFCKKTGRVRRTAERRIDAQILDISATIRKNAQSLQAPNWFRVSPLMPNQASDLDKMATITNWMAEDAKPKGHAHLRQVK
jgi:hypothetical protein